MKVFFQDTYTHGLYFLKYLHIPTDRFTDAAAFKLRRCTNLKCLFKTRTRKQLSCGLGVRTCKLVRPLRLSWPSGHLSGWHRAGLRAIMMPPPWWPGPIPAVTLRAGGRPGLRLPVPACWGPIRTRRAIGDGGSCTGQLVTHLGPPGDRASRLGDNIRHHWGQPGRLVRQPWPYLVISRQQCASRH